MKFSAIMAVAAFAYFGASAAPLTERSPLITRVDPALVPEFGLAAGINPTGTGTSGSYLQRYEYEKSLIPLPLFSIPGDCDGIPSPSGTPIKSAIAWHSALLRLFPDSEHLSFSSPLQLPS